jgi:hypothetical protein
MVQFWYYALTLLQLCSVGNHERRTVMKTCPELRMTVAGEKVLLDSGTSLHKAETGDPKQASNQVA